MYPNGINHLYLCAVRAVRAHEYQVREQDFKINSGTLIAARSTPDPKATRMHRGFFRRSWEVLWNLWEHGRFETWDKNLAQRRVRTEERVIVKFRAGSGWLRWLGWSSKKNTTVKLKADVTDYGGEDWVIRRKHREQALHEQLHRTMQDCLGASGPSRYAAKEKSPTPVTVAPADLAPHAQAEAPPPRAEPSEAGEIKPASTPAMTPPAASVELATMLADGRQAYEQGEYQEAISALETVTAVEPGNTEALAYLGASHYQLGQLDSAINAYARYVKLVSSDYRTQEFLEELRQEKSRSQPTH